jgi:ABC-type phosphate transport system substrate-binding protein
MIGLRLISILLLAGATPANAFYVVVNEANPISSLSYSELSDLFLKKSSRWNDGGLVEPVDQRESSPVRETFNRDVHRKSAAAVRAFWQLRIFSGRDVPPPEKGSDAEVIAYVRNNPNAIGYISASASAAGVKVVAVHP